MIWLRSNVSFLIQREERKWWLLAIMAKLGLKGQGANFKDRKSVVFFRIPVPRNNPLEINFCNCQESTIKL
jgi:hypothetical protein